MDFGKKWYGIECSDKYWADIKPIFNYLDIEKAKQTLWKDLPNKEDDVYTPLLIAFKEELDRQNEFVNIAEKLVEYLLGEFDFYKVIGIDSTRTTQVQSYNLRGTLNQEGKNVKEA